MRRAQKGNLRMAPAAKDGIKDANTATIAEFYLGGLLHETSTAVVLLFGYGIGAGVIVDGRLVRGKRPT